MICLNCSNIIKDKKQWRMGVIHKKIIVPLNRLLEIVHKPIVILEFQ